MNNILALDLGTKCGYAIGSGDRSFIVSGVWDLSQNRYSGGGMRFLRFRQMLDEAHAARPIDQVVFEEVRRHIGTDAAHVFGGILAVLTMWCEQNEIPYQGTPVGTIKKFATGKGNAGKPEMIAAARRWGFEPQDDNEADALALFHLHTVPAVKGSAATADSAAAPPR